MNKKEIEVYYGMILTKHSLNQQFLFNFTVK